MNKKFFENNKVLTSNLIWFIALLPVVMFSTYKNGFLLVSGGHISLLRAFYYLYVPLLIIIFSYLFEFVFYKFFKKEKTNRNIVNSTLPLYNVLCFLVTGPNDKVYIVLGILFMVCLLSKTVKFNYIALFKIIIFIILSIYGGVNNANILQSTYNNEFGIIDTIVGFGISEIGYTTLFAFCSYLILCFDNSYKKDIPIICMFSYLLFGLFCCYLNMYNLNDFVLNSLNSGIVFIFVFIASATLYSPVTFRQKLIYGISLGVGSVLFINTIKFNLLIYIFVFVYSIILAIVNRKYK